MTPNFLFFLGTHHPGWLRTAGVPLFVSARRLRGYRTAPRAAAPWALDSGGFSELSLHGRWVTPAGQYAGEAGRWQEQAGRLAWAAVQDWMCEPVMLAKTGLTVSEHQERTVASYLELCALAPDVPWAPVLQGWREADYLRHVGQYQSAGVDLRALPVVGVGSVCRRQATGEVEGIVRALRGLGLRLHGFGVKLQGLDRAADALASGDSMAWSFAARRGEPLPGHTHKSCANCLDYALRWRGEVLRRLERPRQGTLDALWA